MGGSKMTSREFEKLVKLHGKSIYGFCCHLTGSRQLADDLYQDTFLKAVELRHKLNGSGNGKEQEMLSARNYLIGIAVRLWSNEVRKNSKWKSMISLDNMETDSNVTLKDSMNLEEHIMKKELLLEVKKIVATLPEKMKAVVYMYYTAGMSIEEISEELHIPKGTVKSRMHKARMNIMNGLEAKGYETGL